jgi:hypothetical protein
MPIFLPLLWLCALYFSDAIAAPSLPMIVRQSGSDSLL